ncbi:MAG: TolC family protein [Phycisphaeraceae bacterium]
MKHFRHTIGWAGLAVVGLFLIGGCRSPLSRTLEQESREHLLASQRAYREAIAAGDQKVVETQRPESEVEKFLKEINLLEEIDDLGGPASYKPGDLDPGRDLLGNARATTVAMTLQRAIALAVRNNLDIRLAQMIPAISDTQVTQAEAVFDATFFSNATANFLDTPNPPPSGGLGVFGSVQQRQIGLETGIRKIISTGGEVTVSTTFNYNRRVPSFFAVTDWHDANVAVNVTQPLLRNFGSDVTHSQIMLARNARDESVQDLHARMLQIVAETEQVYWSLVLAKQRLLIQSKLYAETITYRNVMKERMKLDATKGEYADVLTREELRRADMLRARQDFRAASDALKQLMYSDDLPLSGEAVVLPLDVPPDAPINLNLVESITQALKNRPELRRALLEIKDASIRQRVADNQRLPRLDVALGLRYNSIGVNSVAKAYEGIDGNFIDYLAGIQFEMPIGNRGPEAALEQRRIERQATIIAYRRTAQQVVREVKDAMRDVDVAYELIGTTRSARRASSQRLRELHIRTENDKQGYAPERVDLILRTQETVAQAKAQEAQAISEYSSAIARYFQAMGTLLEQNGIEFQDRREEK